MGYIAMGGEYKPIPKLALRAGYNYAKTSTYKQQEQVQNLFTKLMIKLAEKEQEFLLLIYLWKCVR